MRAQLLPPERKKTSVFFKKVFGHFDMARLTHFVCDAFGLSLAYGGTRALRCEGGDKTDFALGLRALASYDHACPFRARGQTTA